MDALTVYNPNHGPLVWYIPYTNEGQYFELHPNKEEAGKGLSWGPLLSIYETEFWFNTVLKSASSSELSPGVPLTPPKAKADFGSGLQVGLADRSVSSTPMGSVYKHPDVDRIWICSVFLPRSCSIYSRMAVPAKF